MKKTLLFLVLGPFLSPALFAHPTNSSDFSREDFAKLQSEGGSLRISEESRWLPKAIQDNLIATLNYALNPELEPASTHGVNLQDFYHGHVACEKPNSLDNPRLATGRIQSEILNKRNIAVYDFYPWQMELDLYIEVVKEIEQAHGEFLEQLLKSGDCSPLVVYHSFERTYRDFEMIPGDPRRNFLTRMKDLRVEHFTPPNPGIASSWTRLFSNVLQFVFLVDENGVVHATSGSRLHLSRVTREVLRP